MKLSINSNQYKKRYLTSIMWVHNVITQAFVWGAKCHTVQAQKWGSQLFHDGRQSSSLRRIDMLLSNSPNLWLSCTTAAPSPPSLSHARTRTHIHRYNLWCIAHLNPTPLSPFPSHPRSLPPTPSLPSQDYQFEMNKEHMKKEKKKAGHCEDKDVYKENSDGEYDYVRNSYFPLTSV